MNKMLVALMCIATCSICRATPSLTIYFDAGKPTRDEVAAGVSPTRSQAAQIHEIATWLIHAPTIKVRLDGHADREECDLRAPEYAKTDSGLWSCEELAKVRAGFAQDQLLIAGVDSSQLSRPYSRGMNNPASKDQSEKGRKLNRRVQVVVVTPYIQTHILAAPSIEFPPNRPNEKEIEARSYPFTAEQLRSLKQAVEFIRNQPPGAKLAVIGHTDELECQPSGPYTGKPDFRILCYGLSMARAGVVEFKLVEFGADPTQFTGGGVGELYPIALPDSDENRAHNRAVQFVDPFHDPAYQPVSFAPVDSHD